MSCALTRRLVTPHLDQRCAGTEKGFEGGKVTVLPTSADPAEIESKIEAALTSDPSIDVVLGPFRSARRRACVAVVEKMGNGDKVKVASFDLSAGFLKAVSEGKALFAVDQQPYLQGYLPVTFLALQCQAMARSPLATSPPARALSSKDAAASVIEKSSQGIR